MIAKVSTGRSFGGAVRYLHEGHKNEQVQKRAQLLDYNGIRPGMEEMIKDFNRHRWLNPDLGNAVGHISLSYHQQDTAKLSDARMVQHAREVMSRLGMNPEETQFALIRHNDCDHQHCHLVYNRIDYNGQTISDQFSRSRAKEAATIIARQEGLTVAADKKKDLTLTHKTNLPGHDQARYQIYEAIQKELPKATSVDELRNALKTHQIETIVQKGGIGMSFKIGQHILKASAVDRAYSGGKLHDTVEQNHAHQQVRLRKRLRVHRSHLALADKYFARQERAAVAAQQAQQRIAQRTATQKPVLDTNTASAFAALAALMKKRDEAKGFEQLAELMKQRDLNKQSTQPKEPSKSQQINPSKGPSRS